tara:strand:- start:915 stop:1139 length:225 start_codon:yes stop_codon:yes gene_type:complete
MNSPPSVVWQLAQLPAVAKYLPRVTNSDSLAAVAIGPLLEGLLLKNINAAAKTNSKPTANIASWRNEIDKSGTQ